MPDPVSFYREYGNVTYGFVKEFTRNEILAAHLFKEVLACIATKKAAYDPTRMSFFTYIRQLVREKAIETNSITPVDTRYSLPLPDTEFLKSAEVLSLFHKEVFFKRYYEGKSESAIAEQSGVSGAEIKQMLREIVRTFKEDFAENAER